MDCEIYITCHNNLGQGEVRLLDMDGNVKRKVGVEQDGSFLFRCPCYLSENKTSGKSFVSDYGADTLTSMMRKGSVSCQYTDRFDRLVFVLIPKTISWYVARTQTIYMYMSFG